MIVDEPDYQIIQIKIEKGVPFPGTIKKPDPPIFAVLDAMEVNDSFAVPDDIQRKEFNRLTNHVSKYRYTHREKKFSVRKNTDGKYRVWRIK